MATISIPSMQDLLSAGVHFGHKVSRGHPRAKSYIFGARDGVHIIDLAKSEEALKVATQKVYELGKEGKVLLVVGTKKQAQEMVKKLAEEADTPYINVKWVGGLLTNFDEIRRNFKKLLDLKDEQAKGTLSRYTKKEQLLISKKLEKFSRELGGVIRMDKLPDAMFVIDAVTEKVAVSEANKSGILVVGLSDTNANPDFFDYPIPANDDGIKAIKIVCETVLKAYTQGKKEAAGKLAREKAKEEESKVSKESEESKAEEEETAALEEEVEKKVLEESERIK